MRRSDRIPITKIRASRSWCWASRAVCVLRAAGILRCGVLLVAWLAYQPLARAAPDLCQRDASCRQLSDQAATAYREQRYYDAFRLLKQAHAVSQEPRLLVNLARCMERLGLRDDAVAAYERFLAEDTVRDPAERARVERFVDEARAAPRRQWDGPGPVADSAPQPVAPATPTAGLVSAASEPPSQPAAAAGATSSNQTPAVAPGVALAPGAPDAVPPGGAARDAPRRARPVYKNPWLWAALGAGLIGIAVGVGVIVGSPRSAPYHVVEWP